VEKIIYSGLDPDPDPDVKKIILKGLDSGSLEMHQNTFFTTPDFKK
jgi:hypothetical protein